MKILLFSDAHLDASTAGMRRIDDLSITFQKTIPKIVAEHRVDLAIFKGDLADPDSGSILVRVLSETLLLETILRNLGVKSVWINGNHDTIEDGSGLTTLSPLRSIGANVIEGQPKTMPIGHGIRMIALPYPFRNKVYDADKYVRAMAKKDATHDKTIVIGHCTDVPGAHTGSESGDLARGGSFRFPLEACKEMGVVFMANGHFHHQQVTPDGIHIAGALERLRFDEEHHTPGVMIVRI